MKYEIFLYFTLTYIQHPSTAQSAQILVVFVPSVFYFSIDYSISDYGFSDYGFSDYSISIPKNSLCKQSLSGANSPPPSPPLGASYLDRKSTRLNSSHLDLSRMPSSA